MKFLKVILIANILSVILGITYITNPVANGFWNIFGIIFILTILGNIVVAIVGGRYKYLDYLYLSLSSFGLLVVLVCNTVASSNINNAASQSNISIILLFLMLIIGGVTSYVRILSRDNNDSNRLFTQNKKSNLYSMMQKLLVIFLCCFLLVGIFISYNLVMSSKTLVEIIIPQYSFFYSLIFLSISGMISKLTNLGRKSLFNISVLLIGSLIFIVCALPLASVPFLLSHAEESYTRAFGTYWQTIDRDKQAYFRRTPFSIPEYFFGTPSDEYIVKQDVIYYEGTDGVDNGVRLRFDVYMPQKQNLPGENAVLIRIHGGAWVLGDKGAQNIAQVNKYFASQGYVVFDVQYGLNDQKNPIKYATVSDEVRGNFTVDDMVRHLGLFTTYLAEHKEEYGANLNSVFISGGSAGGHLANAVALGINIGEYTDIFDSRLEVKGIIPFYPANGLSRDFGIEGSDEFVDPGLLVKEDSPPCLIFQGTRDGIVNPQIAKDFSRIYQEQENNQSALILMPFAGHANDLYFSGYYNQVFIYYMERFMDQFK